jgi:hypothetical protein
MLFGCGSGKLLVMTENDQELLERVKALLPENVKAREVNQVEIANKGGFAQGSCAPQFSPDGRLTGFEILIDKERAPLLKLLILLHESGHATHGFAHKVQLEKRKAGLTAKEDDFLFDVDSERAAMTNELEWVLAFSEADFDLLDQAMARVLQQSSRCGDSLYEAAANKVIESDTWKRCEARKRSLTVPCEEAPPRSKR